ncbi:MAG: PA14 domain-containing protein, partial [Planctomycetota bacterium]
MFFNKISEPHLLRKVTAIVVLACLVCSAPRASASFRATVDVEADDRMDAVVDVETVGLASIDTVLSADAESALDVVFEGSASMDADGLYRIQVTGTHTWRLWVNGTLVIDYAH